MSVRQPRNLKNRSAAQQNTAVLSQRSRRPFGSNGRRGRHGDPSSKGAFAPPENWYEPSNQDGTNFTIIEQPPGRGYCHVVTPDEVRQRLSLLPAGMIEPLDVVQLSEMTRKKRQYPCYGMQWGSTLYLYPVESSLIEYFSRPPKPAQKIEARMYGGRWVEEPGQWKLIWSEQAIKDFYLNNVLIHELGHLLDDRNASYRDRERYAEWFALAYGYKSKHRKELAERSASRKIRRRHHSKR